MEQDERTLPEGLVSSGTLEDISEVGFGEDEDDVEAEIFTEIFPAYDHVNDRWNVPYPFGDDGTELSHFIHRLIGYMDAGFGERR